MIAHKRIPVPYSVSISATPRKTAFTTSKFLPALPLVSPARGERTPSLNGNSNKPPRRGFGVKRALTNYLGGEIKWRTVEIQQQGQAQFQTEVFMNCLLLKMACWRERERDYHRWVLYCNWQRSILLLLLRNWAQFVYFLLSFKTCVHMFVLNEVELTNTENHCSAAPADIIAK